MLSVQNSKSVNVTENAAVAVDVDGGGAVAAVDSGGGGAVVVAAAVVVVEMMVMAVLERRHDEQVVGGQLENRKAVVRTVGKFASGSGSCADRSPCVRNPSAAAS